jgi:hypothetical protein
MKRRERTKAPIICLVFTVLAAVGVIIGLLINSPILIIIFLLPTAIYEVIRTEGKSTKVASIILLVVLVLEIPLLLFNVDFNIAEFLGAERQMVGGFWLPLGELTVVGPMLIAVLAIILYTRTWGTYTRWLAAVIFFTTLALIYALDPASFQEMLAMAIQQGIRRIR